MQNPYIFVCFLGPGRGMRGSPKYDLRMTPQWIPKLHIMGPEKEPEVPQIK
jgi:hypothetical protein